MLTSVPRPSWRVYRSTAFLSMRLSTLFLTSVCSPGRSSRALCTPLCKKTRKPSQATVDTRFSSSTKNRYPPAYPDRLQNRRRLQRRPLQQTAAQRPRLLHHRIRSAHHRLFQFTPLLPPADPLACADWSRGGLLLPEETEARDEQIDQDAGLHCCRALFCLDGDQQCQVIALVNCCYSCCSL